MIKIGKDILTRCQERLAGYSSVQKENKCHLPAGSPNSTGGQFCSFNNDLNSVFGPRGVFGRFGIIPPTRGGMNLAPEYLDRINPPEGEDRDDNYSQGMMYVLRTLEDAAKQFNYPLEKIHLRSDSSTFDLNGKQHSAAGYAYTRGDRKGEIDLFLEAIVRNTDWSNSDSVFSTQIAARALMKHEITHHRFQAVLDNYASQVALVKANFGDKVNLDDPMLQPFLKENYSLIPAFRKAYVNKPLRLFAKEDGITPYSREWWDAYNNGTANTRSVFHETIAEYATFPNPLERTERSTWKELYKLVDKFSKKKGFMESYFTMHTNPAND